MILGSYRPVVSAQAMSLMVVLCVIAAWIFIPDKEELVSRLDKDGHVERLKALAEEALDEQKKAAQAAVPQSDAERMRAWINNPDAEARLDPAVVAEKKIMCAITDNPAMVGLEVTVGANKLDTALYGEFMDALARRALGLQNQSEAGFLLAQWNQRSPSWETTMRAVQAWRWAVKSDEALRVLGEAVAAGLKPEDAPENIEELRLKLALESNQPNLAFDIVEKQYQQAPQDKRADLLRQLLKLANAGDRTKDASRLILKHLSTVPFHVKPLDEAIEMVSSGHPFADATQESDYRNYATSLAHWQEWANHGDLAIETWFRLSLIGSDEAWTRVLDLYQDVLRTDDFVKVLTYRVNKGISLDKQTLLADILVEQGEVEKAIGQYEAAAKAVPQPTAAYRALGRIYQQLGEWEKASAAFEKVLASSPEDVEAGKGNAFALVRLRKYEQACDAYVTLAKANPQDAELQETSAGICESLGRNTEAREASQRLLACEGRTSTPEEYLELADQFRMAGDEPATVKILRAGFDLFPSSIRMRLTLAEALSHHGEHDQAVVLLAHEPLRQNPGAMDLLISEAVEAGNSALAVKFIGSSTPQCLRSLPTSNLRFALLLDRLNRKSDAEKIFSSLLHNEDHSDTDVWLDLGKICLSIDDVTHAEAFVTRYLAGRGRTDAKAWEILGDIYQAEERNDEALTAYRKAVEMIGTKPPPAPPSTVPGVKVTQNGSSDQ